LSAAALQAQDNLFSADARQSYALVKDSLLKVVGKTTAEDYSFRTTPKGRTFGEMIVHVANARRLMCGVVNEEKSIANAQFTPAQTAKADLMAALKASFDYCDPIRVDDRRGEHHERQVVHWRHDQARPAELEHFA